MTMNVLPEQAALKIDLLFDGIRYSDALGEAATHAFPNYAPYRFASDEHDPTGQGKASIPYMLTTEDDVHVRIKGDSRSPWVVTGSRASGYRLQRDGEASDGVAVDFEPLPGWMKEQTLDGVPMARCGVSLHGDMAVINLAPACEYFTADKVDGRSMRCTFCAYGAPDERSKQLGQVMGQVEIPDVTYARMQETLRAVLAGNAIRHIYLVGGSMVDWRQEGERYLTLAAKVQAVVDHRIPVTCGSGALPGSALQELYDSGHVDAVSFNLEVWSEDLFSRVCPGKHRFVGYEAWLQSLEDAVGLWGRERVYSAMVAGVELEPEHGLSWQQAVDLSLKGADDLCRRGVIPIYSLYWPLGGRSHPEYLNRLRAYFSELNLGYAGIRRRHDLTIWEGFMCHRCAYMQLECDVDRGH